MKCPGGMDTSECQCCQRTTLLFDVLADLVMRLTTARLERYPEDMAAALLESERRARIALDTVDP